MALFPFGYPGSFLPHQRREGSEWVCGLNKTWISGYHCSQLMECIWCLFESCKISVTCRSLPQKGDPLTRKILVMLCHVVCTQWVCVHVHCACTYENSLVLCPWSGHETSAYPMCIAPSATVVSRENCLMVHKAGSSWLRGQWLLPHTGSTTPHFTECLTAYSTLCDSCDRLCVQFSLVC